eukprot:TRINITY_DN9413_c0_g1_i4.p1 TRINITY_DN9413_c0_g1~~TRINITY_DN9413_c0_g1_i4.p1  ORF type:complete len:192 (+),score=3.68 TRINITY_DN9413_c0_g1_i4:69-644(+)
MGGLLGRFVGVPVWPNQATTAARLIPSYEKGWPLWADTMNQVCSFILAAAFIGVGISSSDQTGEKEKRLFRWAIASGILSFLVAAVCVSLLTSAKRIAFDVYDLASLVGAAPPPPPPIALWKRRWVVALTMLCVYLTALALILLLVSILLLAQIKIGLVGDNGLTLCCVIVGAFAAAISFLGLILPLFLFE